MRKNIVYIGVFLLQLVLHIEVSGQENYKDIDSLTELRFEKQYDVVDLDLKSTKVGLKPKNVILLIGDGMGVAQVFAGLTANAGDLYITQFKELGFSLTASADNYITDSAAGGTAIACGVSTKNGVVGMDSDSAVVKSIVELAEEKGLATGLVSTSAITHATPASFVAHQVSRGMYEEIAADFLNVDVELFIGGGEDFFVKRKDGRNLLEELEDKGYAVYNKLPKLTQMPSKLAVLTAPKHNGRTEDRGDLLLKSSEIAVSVLSQEKKGYFLMIEGSQIDWGGHRNDINYVVEEMLDFDKVVGQVLKYAIEDKNTLVIVTSDHETGGLSIVGGEPSEGYVKANFGTGKHTGIMVPVFAYGPGAEEFKGVYVNTEINKKIVELLNLSK